MRFFSLATAIALLAVPPARAEEPKTSDGFKPLFNGTSLAGWKNVNCAPSTFFVKDGQIVTTGTPTGFLRTDRQYENFELELDWMHVEKTKTANSGLFVWGDPLPAVGTPYTRGIEVQVLINYPKVDWATNHGDIFSIHGAKCKPDRPHPKGYERCLPSENRVKGGGEWNHYKVIANNGAIKLHVNGKEVSGVSQCNPRKGYLALESEGAECHFKNIRIKELPSTNPKPEECARVWEGHESLFNGLDLKGWEFQERRGVSLAGNAAKGWKVAGGQIKCEQNLDGAIKLVRDKEFHHYELTYDFKLPVKSQKGSHVALPGGCNIGFSNKGILGYGHSESLQEGGRGMIELLPNQYAKPGSWCRAYIKNDGKQFIASFNGIVVVDCDVTNDRGKAPFMFSPSPGMEIMNVFARELKPAK